MSSNAHLEADLPESSLDPNTLTLADTATLAQSGQIMRFKSGFISIDKCKLSPKEAKKATHVRKYMSLPEYLFSQQTFEYLGFVPGVAKSLMRKWMRYPIGLPDIDGAPTNFVEMATWHIRSNPSVEFEEEGLPRQEDWRACMTGCGVAQELQDIILDPRCEEAAEKMSCKFWIVNAIGVRWKALVEYHLASLERVAEAAGQIHQSLPPEIRPDTAEADVARPDIPRLDTPLPDVSQPDTEWWQGRSQDLAVSNMPKVRRWRALARRILRLGRFKSAKNG